MAVEPSRPIRRPRMSGLVVTLMTVLLMMVAVVTCAWFFHVLPHVDLHLASGQNDAPVRIKIDMPTSATEGKASVVNKNPVQEAMVHVDNIVLREQENKQFRNETDKINASPTQQPQTNTEQQQQPQEQQQQQTGSMQQAQVAASPAPPPPPPQPPNEALGFCPPLSKEVLDKQAKRNTVMITFATFEEYKDFGRTFFTHLKNASISYYIVAVPDLRTARLVAHDGIPCFTALEHIDTRQKVPFLGKLYKSLTWRKLSTVKAVHALGLHVLHSELDVVWYKDPLEYFLDRHVQPDFIPSLDPPSTANPPGDDGLEAGLSLGHFINTGIYFLRASPGGTALLDSWLNLKNNITYTERFTEQEGLVRHMQALKPTSSEDRAQRVARLFDGKITVSQLSPAVFQGAYSNNIMKLQEMNHVSPYALHMTWVHGNDYGKIHRLRELQLMEDSYDYYHEGLYMTVGMPVIETPAGFNEMADSFFMAETHWKGMQAQLRQMYYAFALAFAADRILVLPKLTCHCIHNWFETQQCRLPGDKTSRLPFTCPADYVFDMKRLYTMLVQMRRIQIREYSWLDNPRTDNIYKGKPFLVEAGAVSNPVHEARRHVLPIKFKDFDLVGELGRLKQHPIIHIPNPEQLFGGFTHQHIQKELDQKLGDLALTWCCLQDTVVKERNLSDAKKVLKIEP